MDPSDLYVRTYYVLSKANTTGEPLHRRAYRSQGIEQPVFDMCLGKLQYKDH